MLENPLRNLTEIRLASLGLYYYYHLFGEIFDKDIHYRPLSCNNALSTLCCPITGSFSERSASSDRSTATNCTTTCAITGTQPLN
ncbi:hypothetical protein CDAR_166851 [Caerostris darwini]|uniref:Uncharacterized protein n=1 Tax=Caerostris darwini TaxID=1538125 RepID=A0AAV4UED3_9ARAC|nr:hypothetical protein CDAR_166851 [Caerostris darwini]